MARRLTWSEGGSGERRQDLQVVRWQWCAELRQQGLWQLRRQRDHRGGAVNAELHSCTTPDDVIVGEWWTCPDCGQRHRGVAVWVRMVPWIHVLPSGEPPSEVGA